MRLAESNPPLDHLRGTGNDEDPVAVLLKLRVLMRLGGILDGQRMQIELPLHPFQKTFTGLEQADPDDMIGPLRPLTSLFDQNVGNLPAAGVNSRIDDAKLVAGGRGFSFGQHGRTPNKEAVVVADAIDRPISNIRSAQPIRPICSAPATRRITS